jgi:hypothetical protein
LGVEIQLFFFFYSITLSHVLSTESHYLATLQCTTTMHYPHSSPPPLHHREWVPVAHCPSFADLVPLLCLTEREFTMTTMVVVVAATMKVVAVVATNESLQVS